MISRILSTTQNMNMSPGVDSDKKAYQKKYKCQYKAYDSGNLEAIKYILIFVHVDINLLTIL